MALMCLGQKTKMTLEVFEFAVSTNERVRKVTTDQSDAWKQQIQTSLPGRSSDVISGHFGLHVMVMKKSGLWYFLQIAIPF